MLFGTQGPHMDGAHWLVLTQGLLLLMVLLPMLALLVTRSTRRARPAPRRATRARTAAMVGSGERD